MGFERDLSEGDGLYGTQEAFGQGHFPLNPARKSFCRDFPVSRKLPWAPLGPWCIPYWPFVGQWALCV